MQEYSIRELQEKMNSGELTSQKITQMYLERIDSVDQKVNSIIELNPDAEGTASKAGRHWRDRRRRSRRARTGRAPVC